MVNNQKAFEILQEKIQKVPISDKPKASWQSTIENIVELAEKARQTLTDEELTQRRTYQQSI